MQNNEQNTTVESVATPLAEMSLEEYRATRDTAAAPEASTTVEQNTPESGESEEPVTGDADALDADADGDADIEEQGDQPGEETPAEKADKPKKRGGFQRQLDKKNAEIDALKAQLAGQAKPSTAVTTPEPAAAPVGFDKPKPKLEAFESLEDFTEALTDWKADERDWKRAQSSAANKAVEQWNSRTEEAKKVHGDYQQRLDAVSDIQLTPAHQRLLLDSEQGPEVAYHLAGNREALTKFAAMTPLAAAKELGRLEATLNAPAPKPTTKQLSSAPAPIRPVSSKTAAAGTIDVTKLTPEAYRQMRESGRLK